MGTLDSTGTQNTYIEDSVFNNVGQAPDVDDNGRVVLRHSSDYRVQWADAWDNQHVRR